MIRIVPSSFDASAIVALIKKETGAEMVETVLSDAIMSAVNVTEAIRVLRRSFSFEEAMFFLNMMLGEVIAFDRSQSYQAGGMEDIASKYRLSLGDCVCLTLARDKNLPVYTADKVWKKVAELIQVEVKLIR